jgi:Rad3-related DNA helicase
MYDLSLIDKHFPLDEFRPGQRECIEAILNAFNEGKKFVILEAPTGSGKSVIGMTVAKFFEDAYYLTIQKILQDQLSKDFADDKTKCLKGRNAYKCNYWETYMQKYENDQSKQNAMKQMAKDPIILKTMANKNLKAHEGVCLVKDRRSKTDLCFPAGNGNLVRSTCPYWSAVGEAVNSHTCIMNFHSFLYQTAVTDRFKPRNLMVIDEGHNTEPQLMNFVSLSLTDRAWRNEGIKFPKFDTAEKYAEYFDKIEVHTKIEDIIRLANLTRDWKKADDWKKVLLQYKIFLDSVENGDWIPKWENRGPWNKVTLKPVFVDKHAGRYLFSFGDKVLMMSATILDPRVIYESLGIDPADAFAYRMKNRFPVENRPIYFQPAGSMSYKNKHATMPKLLESIETIADGFKKKKGIIHTHNFEIARYVLNNGSRALKKRLVYQEDYQSKDDMLKDHANRKDGSIIIAPAMHEGLDLKGDLSRFQIICKIPYPSFQDNEQLKIRMQLSQDYYNWLTALKLVQSYGRSVRSADDWADTFMLDQDFGFFQRKCHKLLPKWFTNAIKED